MRKEVFICTHNKNQRGNVKVVTFLYAFYVIRFILHKLFSLAEHTQNRPLCHGNSNINIFIFLRQKNCFKYFCLSKASFSFEMLPVNLSILKYILEEQCGFWELDLTYFQVLRFLSNHCLSDRRLSEKDVIPTRALQTSLPPPIQRFPRT